MLLPGKIWRHEPYAVSQFYQVLIFTKHRALANHFSGWLAITDRIAELSISWTPCPPDATAPLMWLARRSKLAVPSRTTSRRCGGEILSRVKSCPSKVHHIICYSFPQSPKASSIYDPNLLSQQRAKALACVDDHNKSRIVKDVHRESVNPPLMNSRPRPQFY